ncbi:glutamyl-tRNA reductase [Demequina zhanjiangensis]|uniref:Glutamyl-tRNA reductase n=1 Tax=Demequina zhanjiangensis TaxID=3051659 RepID=A0ABT8G4P3_9MICO|nr:glutamyl-tRNA reductase [Demequina sp. SYSU T00b26]MDN4474078.1 glutamyl-tRNA reductase [Demequina sp. SYSU T00b26]
MLMSLVASHRNRDLALLEQLSLGAQSVADLAVDGQSPVSGAVVLPTCNRFEVYLETDDAASARAEVVSTLAAASGLAEDVVAEALLVYEDDDAAQHLMSVASGLESMVVGEREISGQVRRAHLDAQQRHHISSRLDRLFQSALRTSRVVASTTGVGTSGRSVVSVALDLADETVAWPGARTLMIGTGALAESGVATLRARGAVLTGVFSPSGRGPLFGSRHGVPVVESDALAEAVREADVIYACSGGESIVLTPALVSSARAGAAHPLTIVDLALHRDVAPGVEDLRDVRVINLEHVGRHAPGESVEALEAARSIVAHAVARLGDGETERALDPAIVALREHVFGLLEKELARIRPAADADAETVAQAELAEQSLRRFARTLLHTPTVRARELARAGETEHYLHAIRTLYGIDIAMQDDACPAPGIVQQSDEHSI